jgi:hypothetical protein
MSQVAQSTEARRSEEEGIGRRLEGTVALLERRGYAVGAGRLGDICLGGSVSEEEVRLAVEVSPHLLFKDELVISPALAPSAPEIARRAASHSVYAARNLEITLGFVRTLARLCPFVLGVAIAGSLASGGFRESDDVDLNLIVADGRRHLAYVAVNLIGIVHALRYRRKPVDTHSRRPVAPRFMTANLILERSQCFPLARQDAAMAYELLASEPVYGVALWYQVAAANPELGSHFPQLDQRRARRAVRVRPAFASWLFPAALDRPARVLGRLGWCLMQWTRRHRPDALARVAFVRQTMRPYALFEEK